MRSRWVSVAWKIILVADLAVLLYGLLAALMPDALLGEGFEVFSGQSWSALLSTSPRTAEYISLSGRLLGALNIAFAVLAIAIALTSFRKGEVWSWYALLIGNTVGYCSPIAFDLTVGAISVFEQLEIVMILLIYLALAISARDILMKKRSIDR